MLINLVDNYHVTRRDHWLESTHRIAPAKNAPVFAKLLCWHYAN
jgi:hypothetical protein